jgi:methylthioribose-1-phosphate isomerase
MAYGALVFVLGAISYLLWKELKRQQDRHQEHLEKTLGVLQMIESRLPTLVEMNDTLKDIEREVETVKDEVHQ